MKGTDIIWRRGSFSKFQTDLKVDCKVSLDIGYFPCLDLLRHRCNSSTGLGWALRFLGSQCQRANLNVNA